MLLTTTDTIQGHEISEYCRLVCARVQNAKSGGRNALEKAAGETIAALEASLSAAALEAGADAVVGIRVVSEAMTTYASGTAVKLR